MVIDFGINVSLALTLTTKSHPLDIGHTNRRLFYIRLSTETPNSTIYKYAHMFPIMHKHIHSVPHTAHGRVNSLIAHESHQLFDLNWFSHYCIGRDWISTTNSNENKLFAFYSVR